MTKINQEFIIKNRKIISAGVLLITILVLFFYFQRAPKNFPIGEIVTIKSGETLDSVTKTLYEENVIRSPFAFRTHVILQGGENKVKAGDYLLDKREGSAQLARRLVNGKFHLEEKKITIPEGWNVFQIGNYLESVLPKFDKDEFVNLAKSKEGYLFPETYFVSPVVKPAALIQRMSETFDRKILLVNTATSTHNLKDIIIMASILEGEARTTESRRTIAGILWRRLSLGMPLQVDATFMYINGKNTYELTLDDLKIDSLYNTYKYAGLPPGPISNPGIDSINSAVNPINTKYLYFLSSRSGDMYYARTFEEHIRNKQLYLNK